MKDTQYSVVVGYTLCIICQKSGAGPYSPVCVCTCVCVHVCACVYVCKCAEFRPRRPSEAPLLSAHLMVLFFCLVCGYWNQYIIIVCGHIYVHVLLGKLHWCDSD